MPNKVSKSVRMSPIEAAITEIRAHGWVCEIVTLKHSSIFRPSKFAIFVHLNSELIVIVFLNKSVNVKSVKVLVASSIFNQLKMVLLLISI